MPPGPGDDRPDRRLLYAIAGLLGVIVFLVVVLLLVQAGDDSDGVATDDSTTTSTSTSSSTSTSTSSTTSPDSTTSTSSTSTAPTTTEPRASMPTTTTTAAPTTTTAAPPSTIDPDRCTGATQPDDPDPVAITFYDAWTVDDRTCAEAIGTEEAIDTLFMLDGAGASWEFVACDPDEEASEQHIDCAFRYEGGAAIFELRFGAIDGWQVFDVDFQAD